MSIINDQPGDSDHGQGQSSEISGKTRPIEVKVPTSKGKEYICNCLQDKQTGCLSAVSRKQTEITWFMTDYNDLHQVKSVLDNMNNLFIDYQNAHHEYLDVLTFTENQEGETQHYERRDPGTRFSLGRRREMATTTIWHWMKQ